MSTSQIRRLVPGDEVGYYTVIALLEDARSHANRLYQARMGCCGRVVEIPRRGSLIAGVTGHCPANRVRRGPG